MSDSIASLRHSIASATELQSVVRTMKAMAASSIGQYEHAVRSLDTYYDTVQLGLRACLAQQPLTHYTAAMPQRANAAIGVIVFGSDQGLVGQFNEAMVDFVAKKLASLPGEKVVWSVGERLRSRLAEVQLLPLADFLLPGSINAITALVGQILLEVDTQREQGKIGKVYVFHHRPKSGSIYAAVSQQLLPLDYGWQRGLFSKKWPTAMLPEVLYSKERTLKALVREFLFVSLYRACAESLASENASRLAAMQRAEKNIDELEAQLKQTFHRLRQSDIDEELFDVLSGFEALRD
ncbi:F0F1 ATP synthase subunit gamma [Rheinheimera baltica]|uniref:F0F1 ATP synthase subunit gamma n=1 Tax=Rheinheimera baltica TaxID=67576 RepID=UPI00273EC2E3|nr:F0F1 ATP synthase subunit gamma [Rheinheimera baltica]MDP5190589.1 F0F1 ATP synthase subunit gamma [Rheinheimera baltica]